MLAVLGLVVTFLCHVGTIMLLAIVGGFLAGRDGVDFVLHSSFPKIVCGIGFCGPFLGIAGGILAVVDLVRPIDGIPLGTAAKALHCISLAAALLLFFWTVSGNHSTLLNSGP